MSPSPQRNCTLVRSTRGGSEKQSCSRLLSSDLLPLGLLALGLAPRVALAWELFLNPDEALHYLLSVQPSLPLAYRASLTTAHPPLLILLLHYWSMLGNSELVLRLPSVLASLGFCWVMFRWVEMVLERTTALIVLTLLLFLPPLIFLSAEIRQYSLLWLFSAVSLYCLERSFSENSSGMMLFSSAALCLALFSHYSALIFALALGIYAGVRFGSHPARRGIILAWMAGQLGAVASVIFLYFSHIAPLRAEGMPRKLEWLSSSMFQPHHESLAWFVLKANIRFFRYLCWSSVFGAIALLLFAAGILSLVFNGQPRSGNKPTLREVGLLLGLPFLVICGTAIAGVYPYGSTRHSCILAGFAVCGISIAVSRCMRNHKRATSAGIMAALLICNLFPAPAGAYIRPRNQRKALMREAVSFLTQHLPPHSYVLTDQEGGLLLSYYLCHSKVVQFEPSFEPLPKCECGDVSLITPSPSPFVFPPLGFPAILQDVAHAHGISSGQRIWFFQAGWIVDNEPALRTELRGFGCDPHNFGQNVLACELSP